MGSREILGLLTERGAPDEASESTLVSGTSAIPLRLKTQNTKRVSKAFSQRHFIKIARVPPPYPLKKAREQGARKLSIRAENSHSLQRPLR